jgi:hypothetical protein
MVIALAYRQRDDHLVAARFAGRTQVGLGD